MAAPNTTPMSNEGQEIQDGPRCAACAVGVAVGSDGVTIASGLAVTQSGGFVSGAVSGGVPAR